MADASRAQSAKSDERTAAASPASLDRDGMRTPRAGRLTSAACDTGPLSRPSSMENLITLLTGIGRLDCDRHHTTRIAPTARSCSRGRPPLLGRAEPAQDAP